jgi:hypothetical protein
VDAIEQVAFAGHALGRGVAEGLRGRARRALAVLIAVRLGLIALLVLFAHPWLSAVGARLLALAAGEGALHFPAAIQALPIAHARWAGTLDLVLIPVIAAVTCVAVARRLPSEEVSADPRRGILPGVLVMLPIAFMTSHVERALLAGATGMASGVLRAAVQIAGACVLLSALTAISLPLLALATLGHPRTRSAWDAWRWSWRRAGVAFVALGLGATAVNVTLRVAFLRAAPVVGATAPELSALGFAVETLTRSLLQWGLAGAAAVLWIGLVEDPWG